MEKALEEIEHYRKKLDKHQLDESANQLDVFNPAHQVREKENENLATKLTFVPMKRWKLSGGIEMMDE